MEQSFTIDCLTPEFVFNGLNGEIIDYVISSYKVNMKLIYLYYYHPALQIHCQEAFNGTGKEDFVHLHQVEEPGIYHAKFILIMTRDVLEKDLRMLARNHNILQEGGNTVEVPQTQPQKKRVKMIQSKTQPQPNLTVEEVDEINEPNLSQFQMEDE